MSIENYIQQLNQPPRLSASFNFFSIIVSVECAATLFFVQAGAIN